MKRFLPIVAFGLVAAMMVWGLLFRGDKEVLRSAFLDKPAPAFDLPLLSGEGRFTAADLKGDGPVVLNFWASWCAPCRAEHRELETLDAMGVRVVGINYKNDPGKAQDFLDLLGDPFDAVGVDETGRAGIDFGVAALPETFVINRNGVIVYKHVGPINPGELDGKIWPAIRAAAER